MTDFYFSMPTLETERLILRKLRMQDAKDMFEYSRDPLVAQHVLWTAHTTISDSRGTIRYQLHKYRCGDPASWGIVEKASDRLIGTIGFMWFEAENLSAEVGYSMARACWNRGYMTEALQCVINYGFEKLLMNRIEAQHESDNPASGRVMEKCGMRHEGTLRQRLYNKGSYHDMELYAILRKDRKR